MKKATVIILSALMALPSCKKDEPASGRIELSLNGAFEIAEVTKSQVSDYTVLPSVSDFTVTVRNSKSATIWTGLLSEYDATMKYDAGAYTAEAVYGAEGQEGFDKPWISGTQDFNVTGGQTTSVSIPVKLSNSIIKVACTDQFNNYFPEHSFTVTTGSNTVIPFPKGETRAAFIDAYRFRIDGSMTSQSGAVKSFSKEYSSGIEAATCYTIRFDVTNVGHLTITISFNDTLETVDLGDVELND